MRRIVIYFMVFGISMFSFGQSSSIKGTITDAQTSETLVGAYVIVDGLQMGGSSDIDGNYIIENLPAGTYDVIATYVGFSSKTEEVTLAEDQEIILNFNLSPDLMGLDEIVVTGVINEKSALRSAEALTSLKPQFLEELGAQTSAEIFKAIPGIRVESSGGEGNANIGVRGIPVASGGSKFLLIQEDGLPVLQFGDISFGNTDIFLRYDQSVSRIEALKGGSAATLASNSPAGVINFISHTGTQNGGVIATTFGMDYQSIRTDFNFGNGLGNGFYYNIGGFYRSGQGPRSPGFTANYGGQIKANMTKEFDKGYVRVYLKYLNDHAISYMPMPVKATGSADNPTYESIEGYDLTKHTLQSPEFMYLTGVDGMGNRRTSNISDGMRPKVLAVGTEIDFELGEGWRVKNRARMAWTKGSFNSPFPAQVGTLDAIATDLAGGPYTVSYATGANAGQALTPDQINNLNGNGLAMRIHTFDVEMSNMNNFTNDLFVTKEIADIANITFGYYNAYQRIAMTWLWQSYLTDVSGEDGPHLLDVASADSSFYSNNGLTAYGQPFWGNCCTRGYDMAYTINAPYANIEVELSKSLTVDAGIRFDMGMANGYYLNNYTTQVDVNQDNVIQPVEENVTLLDNGNPNTVSYDYNYVSYTIGANYAFNQSMALYGRYSQGGRANADRLLYSSFIGADGKAIEGLDADQINTAALGFKYKSPVFSFTATAFYDMISEQNEEFGRILNKDYESYGLELDAIVNFSDFYITAGGTFLQSEITSSLNDDEVGNTPRRVPDLLYNINPSYRFLKGRGSLGFSLIGTTKVYAQDDNNVVLPGYVYVNAFVGFRIVQGLDLRINSNNLTNTLGFTEMEGDPFVNGEVNYLRARPITGRATTATLTFTF